MEQTPQRDVRWKQRLNNFLPAYNQLKAAVELSNTRQLSDLEKQGLIQAFEFTHELTWNVMKDYFNYQGDNSITGSRDATREAFKRGLIKDGDAWMDMIRSRNLTSHAYNKTTANELAEKIVKTYSHLFSEFHDTMLKLREK